MQINILTQLKYNVIIIKIGGILMNYACISNRPFVTSKAISTKMELPPEAKRRRDYIQSHNFSTDVNPLTKEAHVIITDKVYGE